MECDFIKLQLHNTIYAIQENHTRRWSSRLIPDNTELLEETVIATLKQELKEVLINTISELPVTLEEI